MISCSEQKQNSAPKVSIKIDRLEEKLMRCESREDVQAFLSENPSIAQTFFQVPPGSPDTFLIEGLYKLVSDPNFDSLHHELQRVFPDLTELEKQFESAFSNLKSHYPQVRVPEIKTMISGISNDLFISDSLIIIGLDFYLGMDSKYRPLGYPDYISKRFDAAYLVPSIMLILSDAYSQTDYSDKTMLAEMIYYGKAYAFTREMVPEAHDSLIIWYSEKELKDVKAHEDIVWAHFLQNELFYETNHMMKNKYLGERPKTLEIGNDCPGRVGAWLGWEIVKRYQEQEDDFSVLMAEPSAASILQKSKYKPRPN